MKVISRKVKCKHLKAGELFSTYDQAMWNALLEHPDEDGRIALGQKVYVRTDAPCPDDQKEFDIYRIRIKP